MLKTTKIDLGLTHVHFDAHEVDAMRRQVSVLRNKTLILAWFPDERWPVIVVEEEVGETGATPLGKL